MLNITTFLDANACRLDKTVFYCPERDVSYNSKEILSISSEIARQIQALGVEKGDRVMLYMNSTPEYLFSYFAVWRLGAVAIPTNRVYTPSELSYMVENSGSKVIITDTAKIIKSIFDTILPFCIIFNRLIHVIMTYSQITVNECRCT